MTDFDGHAPLRTRVYIDGYNFYYGCLKGTRFKWLDPLLLFERHILPSALVERDGHAVRSELLPLGIKYFTANIVAQAAKATDSVSSQARYRSALRKLYSERIQFFDGYYSVTEAKARIVDAEQPSRWPRDCQEILVWKLEEKQSDVNLALQIYHDASAGDIDHAVVVTNDTDIAPALEMVRRHTAVTIGLVVPTRDHQRLPNADLAKLAHWKRSNVRDEELAACQLPRVVPGRKPSIKPISWYAYPELFDQVLALATSVRGSRKKAFKWMEERNPYLGDRSPIELVESEEGAARVMEYMKNYITRNES